MKMLWKTLYFVIFATLGVACETKAEQLPISLAIAKTPDAVSMSIVRTDIALDGGSVINDLSFSDGRLYRLSLDFPVDIATNKVVHSKIHLTIFVRSDWEHRETVEHKSATERSLIRLLDTLILRTGDKHERKNARSLVKFLKNRNQAFPMAYGKDWDLTPWVIRK